MGSVGDELFHDAVDNDKKPFLEALGHGDAADNDKEIVLPDSTRSVVDELSHEAADDDEISQAAGDDDKSSEAVDKLTHDFVDEENKALLIDPTSIDPKDTLI